MDHQWIACSGDYLPPTAVLAGHDTDGDAIFVGRADHYGDLLPAKIIPNKGKVYVCHNGNEIELRKCEVLTGPDYGWEPSSNGNVPPSAVKVGRTVNGEILYAGRSHWKGSLCVGKIHPSHGCLYIPYGSNEIKINEYEVLVQPERWVQATARSIPMGALVGGTDADGDVILVGRTMYDADLMPAKVIPAKGGAYVAWGGEEHKIKDFEVLVGAGFKWIPSSNGDIAYSAVSAGRTGDGESLYIGRAHYCGSLSIGKVHPSHNCLYLPFGGKEVKVKSYELLVRI